MGYTSYDTSNSMSNRIDRGYYTKSVGEIFTQSKERKIHESMNPKGVKFRECLDSEAHPNTIPIILSLDVTGSMGRIPHELIKDGLPKLMGTLVQNGVNDASLLFLAVGDHECDNYPLQVGQFESGDEELDLWLTRTYLEGGGGGNGGESYFLSYYFAANHTKLDSFDKRNKKGFLFTVGDEPCLDNLPKRVVEELCGDSAQGNMKVEDLLKAVQKMYNVYHLHVAETGTGRGSIGYWKDLLGQHCIQVDDYTQLPSIIAKIVLDNSGVVTKTVGSTPIVNEDVIL